MAIGTSTAVLGAAGIGAASKLLGGKNKQTVSQELTPEASAAYDAVQRGATSLYNQNLPQVAGLDDATLQGLDMLAGRPTSPFLEAAAGGLGGVMDGGNISVAGINPMVGRGNAALGDLSAALSHQVGQAVGDQFTMAGRSGSPAEQSTFAGELTRQLAPYMFGSFERQMDRDYGAYESYASRDLAGQQTDLSARLHAMGLAPGMDYAMDGQARRMIEAGGVRQQQEQAELDAPYKRFERYANPLIAVAGGQPLTKTTSNGGGGFNGALKSGLGAASALAGLLR